MSKSTPVEPDADDMQAHADLHTLINAAKIHADKKRHGKAMKKHKEMVDALQAVANQAANAGQPPAGAPGAVTPTANGGVA